MSSVTNNLSQNLSQTCHSTKIGKKICGVENDENDPVDGPLERKFNGAAGGDLRRPRQIIVGKIASYFAKRRK